MSLPLLLPSPSPRPVEPPGPIVRARPARAPDALWAAVYLPALAIEALEERADSVRPVAVIDGQTAQAVIVTLSAGARERGLHPGMAAATAGARVAELDLRRRDPAREAALLDRLAAWGHRFTAVVSPEPPAALLLEIGGSLKLFGGLTALRERLLAGLDARGLAPVLSIAPTPRAALWLTRAGAHVTITDKRQLAGRLGELPLAALDLPKRTARDFSRLGVGTLREAFRLPRDGLARRFGPDIVRDWDRALGELPEARRRWQPERAFSAKRELPLAVGKTGRLEPFIEALLGELVTALRHHDAGLDRLTLVFDHADQPPTRMTLRLLAVSRDEAHLQRLTHTRLERLNLPEAATEVRLESGCFRPIVSRTTALLDDQPASSTASTALVETLRARLGREAVCALAPVADPRPELAWRRVEPGTKATHRDATPRRPAWLLQPPRRLREHDGAPRIQGHALELTAGPERIEAGWWSDQTLGRDYYVARTYTGTRVWVYRAHRTRHWFLQGYFA